MRLNRINKIIVTALILRVVTLTIVLLNEGTFPIHGMKGDNTSNDDYRYEMGAILYAQQAKEIIDVPTFTSIFDSMGDWTGHHQNLSWFVYTPLWYWIVCIFMYTTQSYIMLKFFNIFISILTIKQLYETAKILYGEKAGILSAKVFSYLPYPIIFSCFLYKDSLVALCLIYLIKTAIKIKRRIHFQKIEIILSILLLLLLSMLRSGSTVILVCVLGIYIFSKKIKRAFFKKEVLISLIVFSILALVIISKYTNIIDVIFFKLKYYTIDSVSNDLGFGRYLKIQSISQIWKLPLTFFFSIIMPLNFGSFTLNSWADVVYIINPIIMIPIAIGASLFIFKKHNDKPFFYLILLFYIICASNSILVWRQLYSTLLIPIIFFSSYYTSISINKRIGLCILSFGIGCSYMFLSVLH